MSALRARKPEAVTKRLKLFMFGPAGVGKTTAAIQFPNSYIIDCERGAENYDKLITQSGSAVFQTNDINDATYWGIMASNYSKNLLYDNCTWSRFDAHMGVANATIRNSTLGHMGINAIGTGVLTVENSTIHGRNLVNLRNDYGSTWEGEIVIRNSVFVPAGGRPVSASTFAIVRWRR